MGYVLRNYNYLLNKFPLATQIGQCGILMGVGDLVAQTFVENKAIKEVNWKRTAQYAGIGCILVGPVLTQWYKILNKHVGKPTDRVLMKGVKKMAVDQIIFAPTFLWVFLPTIGLVKGKPLMENIRDVKSQYVDIVLTNWTLWPPMQLINFAIVPLQFQVLFVQFVAIIWNTYVSWKTSTKQECLTSSTENVEREKKLE